VKAEKPTTFEEAGNLVSIKEIQPALAAVIKPFSWTALIARLDSKSTPIEALSVRPAIWKMVFRCASVATFILRALV